jgi:uncharacterized protein YodC (DUF2158 family)
MNQLTAGQCVKLKSGGPAMTIRWIDQDDAYCDWFVSQEAKAAQFRLAQLEPVPETPRSSQYVPQREF